MAEMTEMTGESTFYNWLKSASLDKHHRRLSENGITEICHLEDVKEGDAESLGLTKFEYRRLARLYADFKAQSQPCSNGNSATSKAALKTSSSSKSHERFRSNTRRAGTRGCANRFFKTPV